jgi:hypothetical protein
MAPPSKDSRIRLLEPLATEFAAFRLAVGMGNSEIGIIRDAVRAFIQSSIKRDKGLRERYSGELKKLNTEKRQPIRLATKNGEPTQS